MAGGASVDYDLSDPSGARLDLAVCTQLLTGATLNIITSRYIAVAGLTIAIYDIFLLFSDEVSRFLVVC